MIDDTQGTGEPRLTANFLSREVMNNDVPDFFAIHAALRKRELAWRCFRRECMEAIARCLPATIPLNQAARTTDSNYNYETARRDLSWEQLPADHEAYVEIQKQERNDNE